MSFWPAPGALVNPNVRLSRKLGEGGMGAVWVADHLTLRSQVAVKFLAERSLTDPRAVARFSSEAAAAARIRSPHVVQVFDFGVVSGVPFIVMELLQGEDLQARLVRCGALSLADTAHVVRQVAKALAQAHAMGVIHRDIKPANIFLLDSAGETFVKVLDFGLAKLPREGPGPTASGVVFGTPHFISPEQAEGARGATPQADLWSLGVVAYRCVAGQLPFPQESLLDLCMAMLESRFTPPSQLGRGLPAALDPWFARALCRDPAGRFASAMELADSFSALVRSLLSAKTDPSPLGPASGRASSGRPPRPGGATSGGGGALLFGGLGVGALLLLGAVGAGGAYLYARARAAENAPVRLASAAPAGSSAPLGQAIRADDSAVVGAVVLSVPATSTSVPGAKIVLPPSSGVSPSVRPPGVFDDEDGGTPFRRDAGAAPAAVDAGPPADAGAKKRQVSLGLTVTNNLYDPSAFRQRAGSIVGAAAACFEKSGEKLQVYVLYVSASGGVTSVAPAAESSGGLDACMAPLLRGIVFGPTLTGQGGEVRAGYAYR